KKALHACSLGYRVLQPSSLLASNFLTIDFNATAGTRYWLAMARNSAALAGSAGKKVSMRSSSAVTSCAVPKVDSIENSFSRVPPTSYSSGSTGGGGVFQVGACQRLGTPG